MYGESRLASSRGRTGGLAPSGLVRVPAARQVAQEIKTATTNSNKKLPLNLLLESC